MREYNGKSSVFRYTSPSQYNLWRAPQYCLQYNVKQCNHGKLKTTNNVFFPFSFSIYHPSLCMMPAAFIDLCFWLCCVRPAVITCQGPFLVGLFYFCSLTVWFLKKEELTKRRREIKINTLHVYLVGVEKKVIIFWVKEQYSWEFKRRCNSFFHNMTHSFFPLVSPQRLFCTTLGKLY